MNKNKFPKYFNDTSNSKGVRFASKNSLGYRHSFGKCESATTLSLDFWMEGTHTPQVSYREFRKIGKVI